MSYTVKVNHPHFPEGTELNVGGLGRVPNGSSVEVDEDMERMFMLQHGRTMDDAFANDGIAEISGSSALDKSEVDQIKAMFAEPEEEIATLANEGEPLVNPRQSRQSQADQGELFGNESGDE